MGLRQGVLRDYIHAWSCIPNSANEGIQMKKFAFNAFAVLAFSLGLVTVSHALPNPQIAPEVDPAVGISALALIGGAVMVIRGRRKA
jgi:hypothetical protein